MVKYLVKRLLMLIPVVLGISLIIFLTLSLSQSDPAALVLGPDASPEALITKREEMGLNDPLIVQFLNYILNVFRGDLGTSWITGADVLSEFLSRIPNTVFLAMFAMTISVCIGIPFGVIAAVRQYHIIDYVTLTHAIVLASIPAFWLGMMTQTLFSLHLRWLPASGVGSFWHFLLPAFSIGGINLATQMRIARSSMLDVLNMDYIRTARAKGASEKRVVMKHVLKNGMLPVVTQVGISFANIMGGAVITETVFAIPGVGLLLVNAVRTRDVPVVMGSLIFIAIFVGIINLIVDIIYAFVDPRVKLGEQAVK